VVTYEGNSNGFDLKLNNVLYSSKINKNLISGIKLIREGMVCKIIPKKDKVCLTLKSNDHKQKRTLGPFKADKNNIIRLTTIDYSYEDPVVNNILYSSEAELDNKNKMLWHRRLGHFYHENLDKYLSSHDIKVPKCIDCQISKLRRKPYNGETPKANSILDVIHSDLIGPIQQSFTGKRYILTFIDDFSRKSWIFLIENKTEVPKIIINFLTYLNNQFENKIKNFKTDQGKEYVNKKVEQFCRRIGIRKSYSQPYNPQNNGKSERFNYTLVNCAKTLLYWSKLDTKFWDYAVKYANILYNKALHQGIGNKIPEELFYSKPSNLKYNKVFGCRAYFKDFS